MTATYDPRSISITFKGVLIQGFTDGDFVTAERNEDTFTSKAGADGRVTRTHNRNAIGKVTLVLMSEAPTNEQLSAIHASDVLFHDGIGSLLIKDTLGTTLVEADEAWIMKPPAVKYGKESGEREWVIECADLDIKAGSSLVQ